MKDGFTFIEMLAVLAIISLVASLTAGALLRGDEQSRLRKTMRDFLDCDALARLSASTSGSLSMRASEGTIRLLTQGEGEVIASRTIALPPALSETETLQPISEVAFNARGESQDYIIKFTIGNITCRRAVCGLTGWVRDCEVE